MWPARCEARARTVVNSWGEEYSLCGPHREALERLADIDCKGYEAVGDVEVPQECGWCERLAMRLRVAEEEMRAGHAMFAMQGSNAPLVERALAGDRDALVALLVDAARYHTPHE